jgi:hypothetical protein
MRDGRRSLSVVAEIEESVLNELRSDLSKARSALQDAVGQVKELTAVIGGPMKTTEQEYEGKPPYSCLDGPGLHAVADSSLERRWRFRSQELERRANDMSKTLVALQFQKESAEIKVAELSRHLGEVTAAKDRAERRAIDLAKQLVAPLIRTSLPIPDAAPSPIVTPCSTPRGLQEGASPCEHPLLRLFQSGDSESYAKAVRSYQIAAENGNALAQYSLGHMYDAGHGVCPDRAEAMRWYTQAAQQGHRRAQISLDALSAGR